MGVDGIPNTKWIVRASCAPSPYGMQEEDDTPIEHKEMKRKTCAINFNGQILRLSGKVNNKERLGKYQLRTEMEPILISLARRS